MTAKVCVTKPSLMQLAEAIVDIVLRKNKDYGDAWQTYGIFTPLIRINDKILRIKTLSTGQQALVADEKITDTLQDIVAYGLLALLRLSWEAEGQHNDVNIPQPELPGIQPNGTAGDVNDVWRRLLNNHPIPTIVAVQPAILPQQIVIEYKISSAREDLVDCVINGHITTAQLAHVINYLTNGDSISL